MAFRNHDKPEHEPENPYLGLRGRILGLDPAEAGLTPSPELPEVWGLLMETGHEGAVSTLVALADGSTSLYLSTGGGVIGAGEHPQVAAQTKATLRLVQRHLAALPALAGTEQPARDRVVLRVLTYQGPRGFEAAEEDLGYSRHPLSPLFHAAHSVLGELIEASEAREW